MNVKGVIIAAGYGTRFLPVTKTVPKEMLPLIDKPAISFIVEEYIAAGIRDILIVSSRRKKVLEDFFDREVELENLFRAEGNLRKLTSIEPYDANFYFVRQHHMKGTGQALLLTRPFVGDDPFVVAYPDDIFIGEVSLSRQLIDVHRVTGGSVLAVQDHGSEDVSRYGVVDPADNENPCRVNRLVEKPSAGEEPSKLVSYGRYLFTPDLFEHLARGWAGHQGGEFYHIDALNAVAEAGRLTALRFTGERLDTGEPLGYLEAICRYALSREDMAESARALFQRLGQ